MILQFTEQGLADYRHWKSHSPPDALRVKALLEDIVETPLDGLGNPEPLRFDLQGYWSRRVNREHRLVYKITPGAFVIVSCRYHYEP